MQAASRLKNLGEERQQILLKACILRCFQSTKLTGFQPSEAQQNLTGMQSVAEKRAESANECREAIEKKPAEKMKDLCAECVSQTCRFHFVHFTCIFTYSP